MSEHVCFYLFSNSMPLMRCLVNQLIWFCNVFDLVFHVRRPSVEWAMLEDKLARCGGIAVTARTTFPKIWWKPTKSFILFRIHIANSGGNFSSFIWLVEVLLLEHTVQLVYSDNERWLKLANHASPAWGVRNELLKTFSTNARESWSISDASGL